MLVHMSSTNLTINVLLEEALNEPDIGTTSRFRWHATAVGIAALWIDSPPPSTPPFEDALKEGLNVGLDLSREEREFHQSGAGTGSAVSFIKTAQKYHLKTQSISSKIKYLQ